MLVSSLHSNLNVTTTAFGVVNDAQSSDLEKIFSKAINCFALDFYQDLSQVRNLQEKNFIFFTPNLLCSLSMLYTISPEKLQKVFEEALYIGDLKKDLWQESFNSWLDGLMERGVELRGGKPTFLFQQILMLACQENTALTPKVEEGLNGYNADNFVFLSPNKLSPFINVRVEVLTKGIIKEILKQEELAQDLVLLIANAALFKGQWKYPFDKNKNTIENFTNSDGTIVEVEMMNLSLVNHKMAYAASEDYVIEMLELPFRGDISLILMQPNSCNKKKPKDQLQNFMTKENILSLLNDYDIRFSAGSGLDVGIPKLDLTEKVDFLEELAHTGLAEMIKETDFSGSFIDSNKPITTPKLVSKFHFKMDEEGSKMAGASYSKSSAELSNSSFKLDSPFGIVIFDRITHTILSMGQVLNLGNAPK